MAFPTSAEIKATLLAGWKGYWPVFITLLFTYLGWLALCKDDGYFVQAVWAVGVIIFLPLFNLQKISGFMWLPFLGWSGGNMARRCPVGHCFHGL